MVSLTVGELVSWREVPGAQPGLTFSEFLTPATPLELRRKRTHPREKDR